MLAYESIAHHAYRVAAPMNWDHIGPNSIDVTLGNKFWVPKAATEPASVIDLSDLPEERDMYDTLFVTDGAYALAPGKFIKAQTAEYLTMPHEFSGMFSLRSAMAQAGLEQLTSVWIRPNWNGHLILELLNVTNKTLLLKPGLRIGQIHLFRLETSTL